LSNFSKIGFRWKLLFERSVDFPGVPEAPTNVSRIGIAKIRFCPISHSSFFRDGVEVFFCNVEFQSSVNSIGGRSWKLLTFAIISRDGYCQDDVDEDIGSCNINTVWGTKQYPERNMGRPWLWKWHVYQSTGNLADGTM
jgi:hypothetical protein